MFNFLRTQPLVSTAAAPSYIPTNSTQGLHFLDGHIFMWATEVIASLFNSSHTSYRIIFYHQEIHTSRGRDLYLKFVFNKSYFSSVFCSYSSKPQRCSLFYFTVFVEMCFAMILE